MELFSKLDIDFLISVNLSNGCINCLLLGQFFQYQCTQQLTIHLLQQIASQKGQVCDMYDCPAIYFIVTILIHRPKVHEIKVLVPKMSCQT